jgi:DMSO/TMAO reductase YedYZ molybdopterin-dependent catalytic subunit
LTGLASGALLSAAVIVLFVLGARAGLVAVPLTVFDWFNRVLPGRLMVSLLDLALRVLRGLGFVLAEPEKTAEQVLAVTALFVVGLVVGVLFFTLVKNRDRGRVRLYGLIVGAVGGLFALGVTFAQGAGANTTEKVLNAIWIVGLFVLWGAGLAHLHWAVYRPGKSIPQEAPASGAPAPAQVAPAPVASAPAPVASARMAPVSQARVLTRRRFIIEMGGLAATIVVAGAGLGEVLRSRTVPGLSATQAPIAFPNAGSPVKPVPGTRPEYTAVSDHYRTDINLQPPSLNGATWQLPVDGQVSNPLVLSLDQIRSGYQSQDLFVTLSCVSNPLGGSLIGTTLWTGVPFRDILAEAQPLPSAHYAHITAADGYDEVVDIATVQADPRIMLVYDWNGEPIPEKHGYPLRICIPNLYGMKQPKWITGINLVPDFISGYWVVRGWDKTASMKATSVIDTVATDSIDIRGGQMYVPIGGIAHAGDRGISKVEVRVDSGEWTEAQLRQPLSQLTWVIWRYDWPFAEGTHLFAVRATDGQGQLQQTETTPAFPSGATGIYDKIARILRP